MEQGDPLAHFLFLPMAKGISGLVSKILELGLYYGFRVGTCDLVIFHLQYGDCTLLVAFHIVENLWIMMLTPRGLSQLWVNFFTNNCVGVNVDLIFLASTRDFLHCKIENLMFRYTCLLVGDYPRFEYTWNPIVSLITNRLHSWKHKYASLGE